MPNITDAHFQCLHLLNYDCRPVVDRQLHTFLLRQKSVPKRRPRRRRPLKGVPVCAVQKIMLERSVCTRRASLRSPFFEYFLWRRKERISATGPRPGLYPRRIDVFIKTQMYNKGSRPQTCSATNPLNQGRKPPMVKPPSTSKLCPVTKRASSDNNHSTASATSSG
jgi:hypothetical protein